MEKDNPSWLSPRTHANPAMLRESGLRNVKPMRSRSIPPLAGKPVCHVRHHPTFSISPLKEVRSHDAEKLNRTDDLGPFPERREVA
jgi:hypothetical protein